MGCDCGRRREGEFVPAKRSLEPINSGRRTCNYRLVVEMPLEIQGQPVGRFVTARAVFLQTLHHDPIEIALE